MPRNAVSSVGFLWVCRPGRRTCGDSVGCGPRNKRRLRNSQGAATRPDAGPEDTLAVDTGGRYLEADPTTITDGCRNSPASEAARRRTPNRALVWRLRVFGQRDC